MDLSGGKQSNGKMRWRWTGNVKMDLHDRQCVCWCGGTGTGSCPRWTLILTVLDFRVPLQEVQPCCSGCRYRVSGSQSLCWYIRVSVLHDSVILLLMQLVQWNLSQFAFLETYQNHSQDKPFPGLYSTRKLLEHKIEALSGTNCIT